MLAQCVLYCFASLSVMPCVSSQCVLRRSPLVFVMPNRVVQLHLAFLHHSPSCSIVSAYGASPFSVILYCARPCMSRTQACRPIVRVVSNPYWPIVCIAPSPAHLVDSSCITWTTIKRHLERL
ncbi:hypothetical protein BHE74_00015725 [Ensete ventricosum]|nr:hypothetical protein BHE74_00015725 [Ensete ventricosum]